MAGTFFLIYSICDALSGSIYLWVPTLFIGSRSRALIFSFSTVGSQIAGFILFFLSHDLVLMAISIGLCGIGTSSWFVNYQTLMNVAFPRDEFKKAASVRQMFEAVGFLLPSICLAIFFFAIPDNQAESVVSITASVLGAIAFVFYVVSMSDVVKLAAMPTNFVTQSQRIELSVWQSTKLFFKSSILRYFLLNSILLAMSNILGGTMAIMTTYYFRLEDTSLWAGALGIPVGGIMSAAIALFIGRLDETLRFYTSSMFLIFTFVILLASTSGAIEHFEDKIVASYITLFSFGVVVGYFFSEVWAVAFACWLKELKRYPTAFVSRANSFHNIGVQAILAISFQLQTLALDNIKDLVVNESTKDYLIGAVLYGMLILLLMVGLYLYASRPALIKLSNFHWAIENPKPSFVKVIAFLTRTSVESMLFGSFCGFRTNHLTDILDDDALTDGGVGFRSSSALQFDNFVSFLNEFCDKNKGLTRDEFYANEGVELERVLFSNAKAFDARMDLIEKAQKSIILMTWSLDGEMTMTLIDKLISIHRYSGIDTKVMIDGVNFYYLCLLLNTTEGEENNLMVLKKLVAEGIDVRFLVENKENPNGPPVKYKCGSHRKILLVDDKYMISGGRNTEDSYLKDEGIFHDTDVILKGDLASSTTKMLDSLWNSGTDVLEILNGCKHLDNVHKETKVHQASISQSIEFDFESSRSSIGRRRSSLFALDKSFYFKGNRSSLFALDNSIQDLVNHTEKQGGCNVIELNHISGNANGVDIIYSTILKLIESATREINLVFGYFQLFPHMEEALSAAIKRGVSVKLLTNSSETNDLYFFRSLFERAQGQLLNMGVEVFLLTTDRSLEDGDCMHCAHHKFITIDNRAVLLGSWNCLGTSIFYDSEYAMLLFDDVESDERVCKSFNDYVHTSIEKGIYTKLGEEPKLSTLHPLMKMAISRQSIVMANRGF